MLLRVAVAIALGFFVAGEPAFACLYPPPPLKLPGEAEEAWKKRATEQLNAHIQEAHRATEAKYFVQAHAIYFARIIRSEEIKVDGTPYGRRVVVKPLEAIRGPLRSATLELRDRELTSCGLDGDGWATWGQVSHIVVVFEGVENEGMSFHSSIFSEMAAEAMHPKLVEAWSRWKARANFLYDSGSEKER